MRLQLQSSKTQPEPTEEDDNSSNVNTSSPEEPEHYEGEEEFPERNPTSSTPVPSYIDDEDSAADFESDSSSGVTDNIKKTNVEAKRTAEQQPAKTKQVSHPRHGLVEPASSSSDLHTNLPSTAMDAEGNHLAKKA